jgi:hypothetical protein
MTRHSLSLTDRNIPDVKRIELIKKTNLRGEKWNLT